MKDRVYIINTTSKITGHSKVSQEGYTTLKEAHKFIATRLGNLEKINEWVFETSYWIYEIVEVTIA